MRGSGIFSTGDEAMARFLAREAAVNGNQRFVARNFLLDESVCDDRLQSYRQADCVAEHPTFEDWKGHHEQYFREQIAKPAVTGRYAALDGRDTDTCPETFRMISVDSGYQSSDTTLDLIRLVCLSFIAEGSGEKLADLRQWAASVVASPADRDTDASRQLDAALQVWNESIDSRPTFAAFWEAIRELWEPTDQPDWADQLRDWLGLAHLSPDLRGLREIDVIAFRYPVSAVPKLIGTATPGASRPLVTPTVLDGLFSHAFCPSPKGQRTGHTVR